MSTHKSLGVGALFFLLAIFNALASPANLVLCVADRDHVAIETQLELSPCVAPLTAAPQALGGDPVESCSDTPLFQATLRLHDGASPAAVMSPVLAWWSPEQPALARIDELGGGSPGILRALRTVVLLV